MKLRSGRLTEKSAVVIARRRNPKRSTTKVFAKVFANIDRPALKSKIKAARGRSVAAVVPAPAPAPILLPGAVIVPVNVAAPSSYTVLLRVLDLIGCVYEFIYTKDLLRLSQVSKGCFDRTTNRPALLRDLDFYQFDSSNPEKHALSFWRCIRRTGAVPSTIRLRYGLKESEIVYSMILSCQLSTLKSLSLTLVEASPFLLCNGNRFGLFAKHHRSVVDLTATRMQTKAQVPAGANSRHWIDTEAVEAMGIGNYLLTVDPTYVRPNLSAFSLASHLSVFAPNLTRLNISVLQVADVHELAKLQQLTSLELSLTACIDLVDYHFPTQACVFAALDTVSKLKKLKTFILRDSTPRKYDNLSIEIKRGFVLRSESLEFADFSKCFKMIRLVDVQCPNLKKLWTEAYPPWFHTWSKIVERWRYGKSFYIDYDGQTTSFDDLDNALGPTVLEQPTYGQQVYQTDMFSYHLETIIIDGVARDVEMVHAVHLPEGCYIDFNQQTFGSEPPSLPEATDSDGHGGPYFLFTQTQQGLRHFVPHGHREDMTGVYV